MATFGKAQYIARVEDDRLLTGIGRFTDNLTRPDQAHVTLVRSTPLRVWQAIRQTKR